MFRSTSPGGVPAVADVRDPSSESVFLLYHVSHRRAGQPALHRDADGELIIDPGAGDDVKLLGCYSTSVRAARRIDLARELPGFREEPECFVVSEYVVDRDEWTAGFETFPWDGAPI